MRRIILMTFLSFITNFVNAQQYGNITGKFYITNIDFVVEEYDFIKKEATGTRYIVIKGTKFTAYELTNQNELVVQFWHFNSDGTQTEKRKRSLISGMPYITEESNGKYFIIDLDDFNKKTSEYYGANHSFTWGFSTLPIKLRFGGMNRNFEFEKGFSLGINAGYDYQFKSRIKQSIDVLFGIGISTVAITPESVSNYIDKATTIGAFSPSLGVVYSYESFQIGLFSGYDFIPGELGKKWVFRNKPWLGLGLGFIIFQKNKTTISGTQTQ